MSSGSSFVCEGVSRFRLARLSESPVKNAQPSELFLESDVLVLFELPETSCFLVFFGNLIRRGVL